jgi:hypothetical protein
MSYIRSSEFTSPAPASEYFDTGTDTGIFTVTIPAPQGICNPTSSAGYITFKRIGNTYAERDYFAAGQYKPWVVEEVYGTDGVGGLLGSTVRCSIVGGPTGTGDYDGTTTTTAEPTTTVGV